MHRRDFLSVPGMAALGAAGLSASPAHAMPAAGPAAVVGPGPDATQRLNEQLTVLARDKGGLVLLEAGDYHFDAPVELEVAPGRGIGLVGAGAGLTRLHWAEGDGIVARISAEPRADGDDGGLRIEGLSLLTTSPGGAALRMEPLGDARGGIPPKVVRDLALAGGWDYGVDAFDLTFVSIDEVIFRGLPERGVAVRFDGPSNPVDNYVSRLRMLGGQRAVEISGTTEGIYVQQITVIGAEEGVLWDVDGHEPLLLLTGSHMNVRRCCIRGIGLMQPIIVGNLLYQSDPASEWTGIHLDGKAAVAYDLLQISQNTIHGTPPREKPNCGIVLERVGGGIVQGNVFSAVDTGVLLGAETTRVAVLDTVLLNSEGPAVVDEGEGNTVRAV